MVLKGAPEQILKSVDSQGITYEFTLRNKDDSFNQVRNLLVQANNYLKTNQLDEAHYCFSKILTHSNISLLHSAASFRGLATVYLAKHELARAEIIAKIANEIEPNHKQGTYLLAKIKKELGQIKESKRLVNQAEQLDEIKIIRK